MNKTNVSNIAAEPQKTNFFKGVFSSLQYRNFALYFFGQVLSLSGTWVQNIAMSWLVYRLTNSVLLLATVTFLCLIPSLFITPIAGVLSDRYNRYKILLTTQTIMMVQAFVLALLTITGLIEVWMILVISLLNGLVASVESPSRQAFYTRLVPREVMSNAVALNSVTVNSTRFIGPTIGGILIAMVGEGYCFLVNGLSYIAVIACLLMMKIKSDAPRVRENRILQELKEGFMYIKGHVPIRSVLINAALINFFCFPFLTVLPAFVKDILGGDSQMLGYAMSSVGAGSLMSAFYLAARKSVRGLGRVVSLAGIVFSVSLIMFTLFSSPLPAYILCYVLGLTLVCVMASINTLLQTMVDDDKRGRVMSYFMMSMGLNPIGGMLLGWLAQVITLPYALLVYGFIGLFSALIFEYRRPLVRKAAAARIAEQDSARNKVNPF
ncbi:MAG: MFS transporter [Rikenellaceae bacterium]